MSMHLYQSAEGDLLHAGFDRRLGQFFYTVFGQGAEDTPTHSSLAGGVDPSDLDEIRLAANAAMTGVPEQMWESIRQDAWNQVANRVVEWNADGSIRSDSAATPVPAI